MADEVDIPVKVVDRRRWRENGEINPEAVPPASLQPTYVDSRARMRKEVAKDAERSRREVFVSLLEVVDNLDRAIDASKGDDALLQGVRMVRDQFLSKLEGFGVKRIASEGQPFDPALHEAVTTVPAQEAASDGRILGVVAHGYRIGDEVLRPALLAGGRRGGTAH